MKRIKSIISSDSDDEKIDLSPSNVLLKSLKKQSANKTSNKGSKKLKNDQSQMTIEAAFNKAATKRKGDVLMDLTIKKIPKSNEKITETFPSTKLLNLSEKIVSSTSSFNSDSKGNSKEVSLKVEQKSKHDIYEKKAPSTSNIVSDTKGSLKVDKKTKVDMSEKIISKEVSVKGEKKQKDDASTSKSIVSPKDTKSSIPQVSSSGKSKAAYVQFLHRTGPKALGSKEIPTGASHCLTGMTFVITGILDSIERDQAQTLIESHGGKVTKAVSGKTTYLVIGKEPGNSKLQKAEQLKTKKINEDGLFDLIRHSPSKSSDNSVPLSTSKKTKQSNIISNVPKKKIIELKERKKDAPSSHVSVPGIKKAPAATNDDVTIIKEESLNKATASGLLFVDKYRPCTLGQIVGQQGDRSPAKKLLSWLKNFDKNLLSESKSDDDGSRFRAVLLSGPPGIGKTTTAELVCELLGYDVVELNASSVRSKNSIRGTLSDSLTMSPFYMKKGRKYCLIMDEVDGMAGNEDRGGVNELIQVIKTTRHPIICICNDRQSRKLQSLVKYVYDLRYRQLSPDHMKSAILPIMKAEKMSLPDDVVQYIIKASNYDMRQVLNNLQMWSVGDQQSDTVKADASSSCKEFKLGPFDVVHKVFHHDNVKTIAEKSDLFFYDYQLAGLFVQENYPLVRPILAKGDMGKTMKLMSIAADSISMGDIVSTKIHTTNNWGLLPTQAMFSSVIPGEYLHGWLSGRIEFPSWLGNHSKRNKNGRILSSLCSHLCLSTKCGIFEPSTLAMEYGDLLVKRLVAPLREGDVETVLSRLSTLHLTKEDLDLLVEAMQWKYQGSALEGVTTKTKAMLTRAYNRGNFKLPYGNISVKKSLKVSEPALLGVEEGEVGEEEKEEEEEEQGVEADVMVKKREATKPSKEDKQTRGNKDTSKKQKTKL